MITKFFKQGTRKSGNTSSHSVRNYLLNERVENGTAKIIRGDLERTSELIDLCDSSQFTSTYTAGCLSFDEKETLTDDQKQEIMQSFEEALLPEFDPSRYACYWVEHTDKNRLELNFVFAKIDLATGKHLDVWQINRDVNRLNAWKEIQIQRYNLSDPNTPKHERTAHFTQIKRADNSIREDAHIDDKTAINDMIKAKIELGEINNANDVKRCIEFDDDGTPTGYLVKQNKTGIVITNTTTNKVGGKYPTFRLQGKIYAKDFTISETSRNSDSRIDSDKSQRQSEYDTSRTERLRIANRDFKELSQQRADGLRKRFGEHPRDERPSQSLARANEPIEPVSRHVTEYEQRDSTARPSELTQLADDTSKHSQSPSEPSQSTQPNRRPSDRDYPTARPSNSDHQTAQRNDFKQTNRPSESMGKTAKNAP